MVDIHNKIQPISLNNTHNKTEEANTNSKASFKVLFKEAAAEWAKSSTSHGLPNIVRSQNNAVRIMWLLCFLGSISYCGYTLIKSLIKYQNYDANVQMSFGTESPVEFPAVTICNLNPFYTRPGSENIQYFEQALNNSGYDYYTDHLNCNDNSYGYYYYCNYTDSQISSKAFEASRSVFLNISASVNDSSAVTDSMDTVLQMMRMSVSTDQNLDNNEKKELGFKLDDYMLLSCKYNGESCSEEDFSWVWSYSYGNCYTFNNGLKSNGKSKPIKFISKSGSDYGLSMEIMTGDPGLQQYTYKTGIYVLVHNKSYKTDIQGFGGGVNIATGLNTFVAITRSFRTKLGDPYSNCLKEWQSFSDYSKKIFQIIASFNLSLDYSQQLCYRVCMQDYMITNCSCMDSTLPNIKNGVPFCNVNTNYTCFLRINYIFSTLSNDDLCQNSCPQECNSIIYKINTHSANYPTSNYIDILKTKKNFSYFDTTNPSFSSTLKEYILKVDVNYNELAYEIISESPAMTIEDLLGVLGGQLGLFIGISFLSLIEVCELLIKFIMIYIRTKKRRNFLDSSI